MRVLSAFTAIFAVAASPLFAGFSFPSIDGGTIDLDDYAGKPVLVVNTASLCGFAGQFDDLQDLHDTYAARGLVVLAVPSDDFRQELASAAEVKEYCAANFDLTIPMTDITHVTGAEAHPFYSGSPPNMISFRHGISTRCCLAPMAMWCGLGGRSCAP